MVNAICKVLRAMQPSTGPLTSMEEALRPWARRTDKYVLTGVLQELKTDPSMGLAFFRWGQTQLGVESPDCYMYNVLIGMNGRAKNLLLVNSLYEDMQQQGLQPNIVTFSTLLDAYGRAGMWNDVDIIRSTMEAQGLAMDIMTCSKAIDAFRAFMATGGEPDTKLYSRLIWLHSQCGHFENALEVLRRMKATGYAPNLITYNTLLDAYGKAGRVNVALHLLEEMGRQGVLPDVVTYSTLVNLCGQNGMCEEAVRFFNDMQLRGISPTVETWTSIVHKWGRERRPDKAQECFNKMLEAGCRPNVVSYTALLQAYAMSGMHLEAQRVLLQLQQEGMAPQPKTWALMSMWGKEGKPQEAQECFDRMLETGYQPGIVAYNILLSAYLKGGMLSEAKRVLLQIKSFCKAPLDTYVILFEHRLHCTSEENRNEVWELMELSEHHMHRRLKQFLSDQRERSPHNDDNVQADVDALLESTRADSLDARKVLVNTLVGFLWSAGCRKPAFTVWALGRRKRLSPLDVKVSVSRRPRLLHLAT
eukprot:jgi/Mesen1/473/ME000101S10707